MVSTKSDASVRDRLLAAANELFYEEGIHTVGIDRVLERAQVAKASLYSTFGSKEDLVRAYLESRAERRRERISATLARHTDPRARILAVFDALGDSVREPTYRGCAFVNARAEGPRTESKITRACSDSRAWLRALFTELARELGADDAERLGRRLTLLYDGATIAASMDGEVSAVAEARAMAEALISRKSSRRAHVDA
jgi:AcrR family transcriptional regulator